ncbi:MAG: prephenate dehydrogenase/arogenate dehydrogenase family protein [Bacillota bacterium]|nr:prephenate dehydrogenase/arogenate dehydrogenase family protein [Bacillota bacterium]
MKAYKIGIIGLGAIGASIGMALRHRSDHIQILGRDLMEQTGIQACEVGVIDQILRDDDITECDLIIIATPLRTIPAVIDQIKHQLKPGALVTDVGSVKAWVMECFAQALPPDVYYIGGHPLAGSEKSGLTAADKFLFENAAYVLTPDTSTPADKLDEISDLIRSIGARVVIMQAEEHDRTIAGVSHVPHLFAASLMNNLHENQDALELAGGGLRDMTRIAASNADLWVDILSLNTSAVTSELRQASNHINAYLKALESHDNEALRILLDQASILRKNAPVQRRCLQDAIEVIAIIPDTIGIIGEIGTILGDQGVHIQDINILGIRDEDEGTLRLKINQTQAIQACNLLNAAGFKAWIRD